MRQEGQVCVMLVTSRGTGRWVLPKGWAEEKLSGPEVAAKEAFEEAGILGTVKPVVLGTYSYLKQMPKDRTVTCKVDVIAMSTDRLLEDWPEREQRIRQWFSLSEAAEKVQEGDLSLLLRRLAAP